MKVYSTLKKSELVMQKLLIIIMCSASFLLTSCAIYKIDVQQGNVVTQEMLNQLSIGMPMSKVRFIMGTPVIVDVFHQQRWDYIYSFQPSGKERDREQRRISLFFENSNLVKIDGDIKPRQDAQPNQPNTPSAPNNEPIL
jgi:outer membrane protein assembly factor BamE